MFENIEDMENLVSENDINETFSPAQKKILTNKKNVANMKKYAQVHGVKPANTPVGLCIQIGLISAGRKKRFKDQMRKKFITAQAFEGYEQTEMFDEDFDNFEETEERMRGFEGFEDAQLVESYETFEGMDEESYDPNQPVGAEQYENLLPIAGLVAGKAVKALAKGKIGKKIGGFLKKAGGKLLSKIAPKANAQQEAQTAQATSDYQATKANLIQSGVPIQKIASVDDSLRKEIESIKASGAKNSALVTNKLIEATTKNKIAILDELKDVLKDYKDKETQKATVEAMPKIIMIAGVALLLGVIIAKKM